jgi:ribose 5-phosphate isomerase A
MNRKQRAAKHALSQVKDGMVLGLGSGTTTKYFIELLAEEISRGELKNISGVPTSEETARLAYSLGIPLSELSDLSPQEPLPALDLAVDGADEVDPQLNLVKGLGRALLREKIVEIHAERFIIIVDDSKLVPRLGRGPIPVEITPFEAHTHIRWLNSLGCRAELWLEDNNTPVMTDNGNLLARCWFSEGIPDPHSFAKDLADRPGIIEHGLFLDMADLVIVAGQDGVQFKERE